MTAERKALRDALRGLLAGSSTRAAIDTPAGYDTGLWARLCKEIGVAGLAVPEAYGGEGATLRESLIVLDELGRTLTPGPMLGCAVLATQALLRSGDTDACVRLLPGICAGDDLATLAWGGDPDDLPCTATAAGRLTGEVPHVLDLASADTLLVPARAGTGTALYEVDATAPGVARHATVPLDPTRRLGVLRLDDAPARRLGVGPSLEELRDVACVALSAEQAGVASQALAATVEYVQVREQFGRPIGTFQALQHRLAEAHVRLEAARSASAAAADALVSAAADAPLLAAVAKVTCTESLQAIAAEMVQMHGGIAITWEHDAHLYVRRAYASAQLFGAPGRHVGRLAELVLPGAPGS
ncbi:acyl-CoA dehydrogenase family protein [Couchioplanes caeruleus]|uniref:Acyl-CoA dehydrogenase n=1 Tax=Couchioplanes caeruleus subsp. caeruleus TaxID=56427 RepID=A0A1K0FIP0_9ACTN|nr:acyl-CoA dehydrogenase family protein [Couchioplanes caeruleus]OJF12701.1 acyl-CoA dehydrogenase [Couchioplanes caeruleus subsp. caeruleus]